MKYLTQPKSLIVACFFLLLVSCGKETDAPGTGTGTGTVLPLLDGQIAGYTRIPIPTVDFANRIIPSMKDFYVTNKGPYILVGDGSQPSQPVFRVYKYTGGSGALAWMSFAPSFPSSAFDYFRPVSMYYEKSNDQFGIYWLFIDKYGMYNVNTGTPSFNFTVPKGTSGPGVVSEIVPNTASNFTSGPWFLLGNQVWKESSVTEPKRFKKVVDLPGEVTRVITIDGIMADPDQETRLWVAAGDRLYQVSSVGDPGSSTGKIEASWNFNVGTSRISTILKVGGDIVIQLGTEIYKKSGTSFSKIGTVGGTGLLNNICTNGSQLFRSDGNYYDFVTGTWKSFLKKGTTLSADDQKKLADLQQLLSAGFPIGCLYGSNGPIYALTPTELIVINPL